MQKYHPQELIPLIYIGSECHSKEQEAELELDTLGLLQAFQQYLAGHIGAVSWLITSIPYGN